METPPKSSCPPNRGMSACGGKSSRSALRNAPFVGRTLSARARTTNHIRPCKTKTRLRRGKAPRKLKASPRYVARLVLHPIFLIHQNAMMKRLSRHTTIGNPATLCDYNLLRGWSVSATAQDPRRKDGGAWQHNTQDAKRNTAIDCHGNLRGTITSGP